MFYACHEDKPKGCHNFVMLDCFGLALAVVCAGEPIREDKFGGGCCFLPVLPGFALSPCAVYYFQEQGRLFPGFYLCFVLSCDRALCYPSAKGPDLLPGAGDCGHCRTLYYGGCLSEVQPPELSRVILTEFPAHAAFGI